MNSLTLKQHLLRIRRHLFLKFCDPRYCKTGQWELMDSLFGNQPPGTFFEAGGHDGWTGSNTYWLEARYGWKGVLVEPVPSLFNACRMERYKAKVIHAALTPPDYPNETIEIECAGLVSSVTTSPNLIASREIAGIFYPNCEITKAHVPARTITQCLSQSGVQQLNFLSLDIEGYEEAALIGLDFNIYNPDYMLIECNDREAVMALVSRHYVPIQELPPHDVLFKRRSL